MQETTEANTLGFGCVLVSNRSSTRYKGVNYV